MSEYDPYWRERATPRTEARSRERARISIALLSTLGRRTGRVLDLGCGPGWVLEVFRSSGFEVEGLDLSRVALESARARGLSVRELDLERAGEPDWASLSAGRPEVVVALEVLEHLRDPLAVLRRLLRLAGARGHAVVSLPNEAHLLARLRMLSGRLPFGGHDDPHLRHFDARSVRRLLAASGARVLAERGVSLVPPRLGLLSWIARPLVALFPGLFTIARIHVLQGVDHE